MPEQDEVTRFLRPLDDLRIEYMVTGATAAILYGQPRVTNDIDLVLALADTQVESLVRAFPEETFYVPPVEVIRTEIARHQRGHFNIIDLETGYKADIYLAGEDPLHAWAMSRRRALAWSSDQAVKVAPPEYVIVKKLEYYREGGSSKHVTDVRAVLALTEIDRAALGEWILRRGLTDEWQRVSGG